MVYLFDEKFVYPSDEHGAYIELVGTIVCVDDLVVTVQTENGVFTGYAEQRRCDWCGYPNIGQIATIKLYEQGGGRYPDHMIISWRSKEMCDNCFNKAEDEKMQIELHAGAMRR